MSHPPWMLARHRQHEIFLSIARSHDSELHFSSRAPQKVAKKANNGVRCGQRFWHLYVVCFALLYLIVYYTYPHADTESALKFFEQSWCLNFRNCLSIWFASSSLHVLRLHMFHLTYLLDILLCFVGFCSPLKKETTQNRSIFGHCFCRYAIGCSSDSPKGAGCWCSKGMKTLREYLNINITIIYIYI